MNTLIENRNIEGLLIRHVIQDQKSKDEADGKLFNWQPASYTPDEWCKLLDYGYILSPCKYSPKADGRYTHSGDYFESTHFFFADGDNFVGTDDATDAAIEPWKNRDEIFERFPSLRNKLYAFSESVSSMTDEKPYRRYRLIFLFDEPITTREQFNHVEKLLALEFPIIPDIDRAPTQPVFGNARKETSGVEILSNILSLKAFLDYEIPEVAPTLLPAEPHLNGSNLNGNKPVTSPAPKLNDQDMTLDEFIQEHSIPTIKPRKNGGHHIRCPWENEHASGKNTETDAYVWENTDGTFAFYCSHATCKKRGNTWASYREVVAPKATHRGSQAKVGSPPNIEKDVLSNVGRHETSDDPTFPTSSAFQHGFQYFGEAYNGIDWICPAYNFAAALAQASMALGRKFRVKELGMQYPNFYQMIIGRSHLAAKSPTLARAIEGVEHIRRFECFDDRREQVNIIDQINSAESFRREFETHDPKDDFAPYDWYSLSNGVRGFIPYDEVATFLSKTRQTATEGISSEITRLYNPSSRPIVNNAAASMTHGEDWVLNFLGCSTIEWYEKFLTQGDFASGFLNRFIFYLHDQMPFKARFDDVNGKSLNKWYGILENAAEISLKYQTPLTYSFTDRAFSAFEKWFENIFNMLIEDDDIKNQASIRVATHAVKLSLVYAILDPDTDNQDITHEHFESARIVAEYWAKCSGLTLDLIAFDRRSKAEEHVLKASYRIQQKGEKVYKRSIRRSINAKTMSSDEINKTIDALSQMHILIWDGTNETYIVSEHDVPGIK